jgi:general secretion pathway protein D
VNDPNPDLAKANVVSKVPEIQSREFESVLRVPSGQTAVLGGLMQDSFEGHRDGLPVLSQIPLFGDAVSFRNDTARKSELVVFLRPIVVRDAHVDGDLAQYRRYLPDEEFFRESRMPSPHFKENMRRLERGETLLDPAPEARP